MHGWFGSNSVRMTLLLIGWMMAIGCAPRSPLVFEQQILEDLRRDDIPDPHAVPSSDAAVPSTLSQILPSTGPISLADLLAAAEAGNPSLAAARSEVGMAAGEIWQASLYPNPHLEVGSEEVPFRAGPREGTTMVSLTQPIVLGGRLEAAVDAAQAERAVSRANVEIRIREIFGEIAQLHARLLAIRQAEALYAELAVLGGQTLSVAQTRFEARAAPETEVIRPQIELYQIDLARGRLAKEKVAAAKGLALLLGGIEIDVARLSGEVADSPPVIDFEAVARIVRKSHPLLVAADREIDAAAARLARIRAERVPDLDVRAGAGYKGEGSEGVFEVGAGITLPLWDDRRGDLLAGRFAVLRARQQRIAVENDLLGRLVEVRGHYESACVQLRTVREQMVPAAARSYEQTQEAYRGGRAAFLELLDAQRTLAEARTTLIQLSGAAAEAHAGLLRIVGPLDLSLIPTANSTGIKDESSSTTERPTSGQR